ATWAIARAAGSKTVADIGLHTAEALGLTIVSAEMIRGPLGRARPRVAGGDAFIFDFNAGFTKFENRSYPSMHSAVAFTTAAAVTQEMHEWKPHTTRYVAPILYSAALIPGMTRMYLNQHWTSDVVAGGVMGAWIGHKVVRYAHSHRRSKLDDVLLGLTVLPTPDGGVFAAVSLSR
ncbi:MAG TPA: phosphatase PAP2 family protein, partial [Gemmatimonadaceae bacterium]